MSILGLAGIRILTLSTSIFLDMKSELIIDHEGECVPKSDKPIVHSFVSAICIPPTHPEILISGGGSADLLVHNWKTSNLIHRIPILSTILPYRIIRAAMRRAPKRIQVAQRAEEEKMIEEGKKDEVDRMRRETDEALQGRGLQRGEVKKEDWMKPVRGWLLPDGEGTCIGKIEVVGESVIFFSEG